MNYFWNMFVGLCNNVDKAPNVVAKELGIPSGSITAWKNGTVPQTRTLKKIADYFGVSVNYLLGYEEIKKAPEEDDLSEGEKLLLDLFRQIPPDKQELALQMLKAALGK